MKAYTMCCINIIVRHNKFVVDAISDGEFASADQSYSLMKAFFHLDSNDEQGWDEVGCLLGQRPNPPDKLGELEEALPQVWQNILFGPFFQTLLHLCDAKVSHA